jgi:hypothetical protein
MQKEAEQFQKGFSVDGGYGGGYLFTIVVTVGIGALLTINNSYHNAQTSRQAIDSLTYILESMSRSIRTAQSWDAGNIYNGGSSSHFQIYRSR